MARSDRVRVPGGGRLRSWIRRVPVGAARETYAHADGCNFAPTRPYGMDNVPVLVLDKTAYLYSPAKA